jgi:hypothetical protein
MIQPGKLPTQILNAYNASLGDFVSPGSDLWSILLQSAMAHAVYTLDLEKVLAGTDPAQKLETMTTQTGWRFLAAGAGLAGAAHVGAADASNNPKLTGFSTDSRIENVVDFINQLDTLHVAQGNDFELRALRITWLKFETLWLHSAHQDWLIPHAGFPEACGLARGALCSAAEFVKAVQARAKNAKTQFAKQKSGRIRARQQWNPLGREKACEQADRLDAMVQVLNDINRASVPQIASALQIDQTGAQAIYTKAQQGPIRHFNDFSSVEGLDCSALGAKKHYIGYGEQASAVGV